MTNYEQSGMLFFEGLAGLLIVFGIIIAWWFISHEKFFLVFAFLPIVFLFGGAALAAHETAQVIYRTTDSYQEQQEERGLTRQSSSDRIVGDCCSAEEGVK